MSDHIPQNRQILGFLKLNGSITPIEAMRRFKCYRLGARIHELKGMGHVIESKLVKSRSGKHFCKYTLIAG
jgi:hypothetical protein